MEYQKETPEQSHSLAGETDRGLDDAAALPLRLARYDKARRRGLLMRDYARQIGGVKEAGRLHDCGSWLLFRDYYTVGKVRLAAAPTCKQHLICPLCAIRRGAKALKVYLDRLQTIRQDEPAAKLYLVTLTVKDGADLDERYRHLTSAMKRYSQQRRDYLANPKARQHVEMAKAIGAVGSYEFKRGKNSGLWHPHVHMVWMCHTKPDQEKLSREWYAITGDSFIVDVTEFRDDQEPADGFLEVFKYALKFSDMPLADNWHGYQTLRTKRMLFSFGAFYGVKVPDDLNDEGIDDQPYVELLFRHGAGGYSLTQRVNERHVLARSHIVTCHENQSAGGGDESFDRHRDDGAARGGAAAEEARAQARGLAGDDAGRTQSPPAGTRAPDPFCRPGAS